jgi:hypothetical protein
MSDWQKKLKQGAVTCRVLHDGEIVEEFTPTSVDQLWTSIVIHDLGETTKSYFAFEYEQFVESGKSAACYECEACETVVKFGKAIQFKETFIVEFEDTSNQNAVH